MDDGVGLSVSGEAVWDRQLGEARSLDLVQLVRRRLILRLRAAMDPGVNAKTRSLLVHLAEPSIHFLCHA